MTERNAVQQVERSNILQSYFPTDLNFVRERTCS